MRKWIPDRKVWSGGLAGLLAFGVAAAVQTVTGYPLDWEVIAPVIGAVIPSVSYLVPASRGDVDRARERLDAGIRRVGDVLHDEHGAAAPSYRRGGPGSTLPALAVAVLLLGGLAACGQQDYAGLNIVRAEFAVPEGASGPVALEVIGGKEQESITFKGALPDGTAFDYAATGVRAFDAFAVRAAVEQAIAAEVGDVAPGAVDAVMRAVMAAIGGPAAAPGGAPAALVPALPPPEPLAQ